jgi:2-dehydro-3-deoxyphosphogalactonate aldolase
MKRQRWPALKRGLVAILRGVQPNEAATMAQIVFEAGIEAVEVPLNSPEPLTSIERIASALPGSALVGAGTVLSAADVRDVANAGGRLMVSPNIDADVMGQASELGLVTMPGVFTPTEALSALRIGASALKFFPANVLGPKGIGALLAILPPGIAVGAVGGVSDKDFAAYSAVGVRLFGLGSSLYKPGMTADVLRERAGLAVAEWDKVFAGKANG